MNEEFQKEISLVLLVNHKNVVKLFGLCSETKMPLLVYEFISNGNLFKNIHDKKLHFLASWGIFFYPLIPAWTPPHPQTSCWGSMEVVLLSIIHWSCSPWSGCWQTHLGCFFLVIVKVLVNAFWYHALTVILILCSWHYAAWCHCHPAQCQNWHVQGVYEACRRQVGTCWSCRTRELCI